jgi:hypothetical protein
MPSTELAGELENNHAFQMLKVFVQPQAGSALAQDAREDVEPGEIGRSVPRQAEHSDSGAICNQPDQADGSKHSSYRLPCGKLSMCRKTKHRLRSSDRS